MQDLPSGPDGTRTRPDGDVEVPGYDKEFKVPDCNVCGGLLKPDVVLFGDGVPQEKATEYKTQQFALSVNLDEIMPIVYACLHNFIGD